MDLSDVIERNAAFTPDKLALRYAGSSLTYAELAGRIAGAARALKSELGGGRGDRVAILAANHPDYLVLLYACARLGAMLVPLNWRLAPPEQIFILSDASVKVFFVQDAFAGIVPAVSAALPDIRIVSLEEAASASSDKIEALTLTSPRSRGEVGLRLRNPGEGHSPQVQTRGEAPSPGSGAAGPDLSPGRSRVFPTSTNYDWPKSETSDLGAGRGAHPTFDDLIAAAGGDGRNPHIDASCPLLLVYTSGTTGRPKGALLRQEALLWNAVMSQHMHDLRSDDHVLTVLPLFHVGGLNIQTTPALQIGATVTLHARFAPQTTLAAIAAERPTLAVLVPSTIQAIIEHPDFARTDLTGLRAVTTGSTQVPQFLINALTARGVPVLQVYGSTETCPIAVYTRLGGDLSRGSSTGLPGLFCHARIVDESGHDVPPDTAGEVIVRGPNVFFEYWGNEAATTEVLRNGWYHTGDIGTRDKDGYFYIHDRKKNVIISGGENIYPAEIERVLHEHPLIAEAAVVGRPDPRWQEIPVAYIVVRAGSTLTSDDVARHVGKELARFKVPREYHFVDALPRNALGKVQHFRLKEQAAVASRPLRSDRAL
ncbi:MAG: class I adenylate-forming enzyme family protein [Xanthobacteraceae bacterium]